MDIRGKQAAMHELAITQSIADIVIAKQAELGASRVVGVWVDAGQMRNLEEKWVQFYFDRCVVDTPAEGAVVHVNRIPVTFRCDDCGADFEFKLEHHRLDKLACPSCGGEAFQMVKGRELGISGIELA